MQELKEISHLLYPRGGFEVPPAGLNITGSRALINARHNEDEFAGAGSLFKGCQKEWGRGSYVCLTRNNVPTDENLLLSKFPEKLQTSGPFGSFLAIEWYLGKPKESKDTPLARAWLDYIGAPIIPADPEQRRKTLAAAYDKLALYVAAWEELRASGEVDGR
jgi:hypothetical protein